MEDSKSLFFVTDCKRIAEIKANSFEDLIESIKSSFELNKDEEIKELKVLQNVKDKESVKTIQDEPSFKELLKESKPAFYICFESSKKNKVDILEEKIEKLQEYVKQEFAQRQSFEKKILQKFNEERQYRPSLLKITNSFSDFSVNGSAQGNTQKSYKKSWSNVPFKKISESLKKTAAESELVESHNTQSKIVDSRNTQSKIVESNKSQSNNVESNKSQSKNVESNDNGNNEHASMESNINQSNQVEDKIIEKHKGLYTNKDTEKGSYTD